MLENGTSQNLIHELAFLPQAVDAVPTALAWTNPDTSANLPSPSARARRSGVVAELGGRTHRDLLAHPADELLVGELVGPKQPSSRPTPDVFPPPRGAMQLGYTYPVGPLRTTDLGGLDVRLAIAEHLAPEVGERFEPPYPSRAGGGRSPWLQGRAGLLQLRMTWANEETHEEDASGSRRLRPPGSLSGGMLLPRAEQQGGRERVERQGDAVLETLEASSLEVLEQNRQGPVSAVHWETESQLRATKVLPLDTSERLNSSDAGRS
jgi:hypothetical protein